MKTLKILPVLLFSFCFSQQKSDADLFAGTTAKEFNKEVFFKKIDTTKKKKDSLQLINQRKKTIKKKLQKKTI